MDIRVAAGPLSLQHGSCAQCLHLWSEVPAAALGRLMDSKQAITHSAPSQQMPVRVRAAEIDIALGGNSFQPSPGVPGRNAIKVKLVCKITVIQGSQSPLLIPCNLESTHRETTNIHPLNALVNHPKVSQVSSAPLHDKTSYTMCW